MHNSKFRRIVIGGGKRVTPTVAVANSTMSQHKTQCNIFLTNIPVNKLMKQVAKQATAWLHV